MRRGEQDAGLCSDDGYRPPTVCGGGISFTTRKRTFASCAPSLLFSQLQRLDFLGVLLHELTLAGFASGLHPCLWIGAALAAARRSE
jgi:hypothetical protein